MYGTVKYYNQQKCYGFIGTSDGKEYFFHISGLNKNYGGKPYADDNVEFKVSEPNDKVWDYVNDCQELLDDSMKYPCGC